MIRLIIIQIIVIYTGKDFVWMLIEHVGGLQMWNCSCSALFNYHQFIS